MRTCLHQGVPVSCPDATIHYMRKGKRNQKTVHSIHFILADDSGCIPSVRFTLHQNSGEDMLHTPATRFPQRKSPLAGWHHFLVTVYHVHSQRTTRRWLQVRASAAGIRRQGLAFITRCNVQNKYRLRDAKHCIGALAILFFHDAKDTSITPHDG